MKLLTLSVATLFALFVSHGVYATSGSVLVRHKHGRPMYHRITADSTDQESVESDSTDVDDMESDSADTDADTLPKPPPKKWRLQAKALFSSQKQHDGTELSASGATADLSVKLSHENGLYASVNGTESIGSTLKYQQTTVSGGYSYEAADWCDLSGDVSIYRYPNDSVNALASSPASMSLAVDFYTKYIDFDLSLDHYFGTPTANYLSLALSHDFIVDKNEDLTITPGLSVAYSSATFKKLKNPSKTVTFRGLSAISLDAYCNYQLGSGFTLFADPTLLLSYQRDLLEVLKGNKTGTKKSTEFVVIVGLRYKMKL